MHVVIVGASVAGIRTAQALRSREFGGSITIVGEEPHQPYDKPPLSKEMIDPRGAGVPVPLITTGALAELRVDLRLGTRATALDTAGKALALDDHTEISYDKLVIACGARARTLPGTAGFGNVHTIRDADDAHAIRRALRTTGQRAVAIGAGFIGAEFASTATAHGTPVTIVEAQEAPLAQQLGADVGRRLAELHTANGATLVTGQQVCGLDGHGRATGVRLSDGRILPADLVVVGIGATPAVTWLESSSLTLENGIVCDQTMRAIGAADVYAAGDVARWHNPLYGELTRIEHWTNANEHADAIAADIVGAPAPRPALPYVWSDQYGKRIQIIGRPGLGSPVTVTGEARTGDLVAAYADDSGVLVGALVIDNPRLLMKFRKAIGSGTRHQDFFAPVPAGRGTGR